MGLEFDVTKLCNTPSPTNVTRDLIPCHWQRVGKSLSVVSTKFFKKKNRRIIPIHITSS